MLSQVCASLFMMLSGYYLVYSSFRFRKMIQQWLEVVLYSLVISLLYCFAGNLAAPVKKAVGNRYRYDSLFSLLSTVLVFLAFLNLRVQNRTLIYVNERAAPATLGVYLIHAHADLGKALWRTLNLQQFLGSPVFPLVQAAAVLGIFLVCILVDLLGAGTIGRLENTVLVRKFCTGIERRVSEYLNR